MTTLGEQAAAWGAARELALGGGEHGFDECTTAVETAGEVVAHLGTDAVDAPGFLAALDRDDAARPSRKSRYSGLFLTAPRSGSKNLPFRKR